jgi:hypothetical protein
MKNSIQYLKMKKEGLFFFVCVVSVVLYSCTSFPFLTRRAAYTAPE